MPLEWLIDIIKEWVIAQAYATEAWVLAKVYATEAWVTEWFTPYSVTGPLNPNATCLYFKAGTREGYPYYRRSDGAWFLWRHSLDLYLITEVLGSGGTRGWNHIHIDIEGEYTPYGTAVGTAAVSKGNRSLCTGFVDRGDPAAPDWTQATLIADGAYHDLDLSAIVPVGTKAALFTIFLFGDHAHWSIELRRKGNVNTAASSGMMVMVVGLGNWGEITCSVDEDRKIEYKLPNGIWTMITMTVKAWKF